MSRANPSSSNEKVLCVFKAGKQDLRKLVVQYFSRKYDVETENLQLVGSSGSKWTFDVIVNDDRTNSRYGVFVRDWARTIGINQMRRLSKACRDCSMDGAILVGNMYGSHAKSYGENRGIQCLYRGQIERKLGVF